MILVAGGTGKLGGFLVRRLVRAGLPVRVLTRDLSRAADLTALGVQVHEGDVRKASTLVGAMRGVKTVVSAVHGFAGPGGGSPASVDRAGNINLIDAAGAVAAHVVLVSVIGAASDHPMELFRAKYEAEQYLRQSGARFTIVRATAFSETWAMVMGEPLRDGGKALVFGRGDNLINFVSAADVAALLEIVVQEPALRGRVLELGGTEQATFNELAVLLQRVTGRSTSVRHIPRAMLHLVAAFMRPFNPAFARQVRAAIAMDTHDMTFDATPTRRAFPQLPDTPLQTALERYFESTPRV